MTHQTKESSSKAVSANDVVTRAGLFIVSLALALALAAVGLLVDPSLEEMIAQLFPSRPWD